MAFFSILAVHESGVPITTPQHRLLLDGCLKSMDCHFFFYFLEWSGADSILAEATKWPIVPARDDDDDDER
jgi:hypothetical protein